MRSPAFDRSAAGVRKLFADSPVPLENALAAAGTGDGFPLPVNRHPRGAERAPVAHERILPVFAMYFGMYEASAVAAPQQLGSKGIFVPATVFFNGKTGDSTVSSSTKAHVLFDELNRI
jgi:hypothetical protein